MHDIRCPKCGEQFTIDEAGYAAIVQQVRDKEFDRQVHEREMSIERAHETQLALVRKEEADRFQDKISAQENSITELKGRIALQEAQHGAEIQKVISDKDNEIRALEGRLGALNAESELNVKTLCEGYEARLRDKDEQIAYYRDLKARQSTKMVGETLEQHCEIEFNKVRGLMFAGVYFEKDNDARTGSKGDYIYRETDTDGSEILSIMFEMKNEMETTEKKHKNSDFFKELDKDRREKGCEYAVLVSMLESDSDLYNQGIVDVSYRYPKMYVIRPQCFIPMITVLRNAAMHSLDYRRELAVLRSQNLDVVDFEDKLEDFKTKFGRNYQLAHDKLYSAIDDIDKAIAALERTKKELLSSENNYRLANDKLENLTVRRLTAGNPTVQRMFEDARLNM